MNYKLTLDLRLEDGYSKDMSVLRRWMTEEKVVLVEVNRGSAPKAVAYGWPGSPPKPVNTSKFKSKSSNNAVFREVAAIVFPYQDCQKLNLTQTNLVAGIVQHLTSKNEFFVTANLKEYILEGKRERLKGSFGVIAVTPQEVVKVLSDMHGWK